MGDVSYAVSFGVYRIRITGFKQDSGSSVNGFSVLDFVNAVMFADKLHDGDWLLHQYVARINSSITAKLIVDWPGSRDYLNCCILQFESVRQ